MIEFEEPDANYSFSNPKDKSGTTKIKVLTLFFLFVLLVLFLAKNDYSLNLLETSIVPVIVDCNILYQYDNTDSENMMIENAKGVLDDNSKKFEELEGYEDGYVRSSSMTQNGKRIPEIVLEFKDVSKTERGIPDKVCGFKISVVYK